MKLIDIAEESKVDRYKIELEFFIHHDEMPLEIQTLHDDPIKAPGNRRKTLEKIVKDLIAEIMKDAAAPDVQSEIVDLSLTHMEATVEFIGPKEQLWKVYAAYSDIIFAGVAGRPEFDDSIKVMKS